MQRTLHNLFMGIHLLRHLAQFLSKHACQVQIRLFLATSLTLTTPKHKIYRYAINLFCITPSNTILPLIPLLSRKLCGHKAHQIAARQPYILVGLLTCLSLWIKHMSTRMVHDYPDSAPWLRHKVIAQQCGPLPLRTKGRSCQLPCSSHNSALYQADMKCTAAVTLHVSSISTEM
jgi:hypothetical protein